MKRVHNELHYSTLNLVHKSKYENHEPKRQNPKFSKAINFIVDFQSVVKLEKEYWHLLDIPKQDKQESVYSYVLRACAIFEKNLTHSQRGPDTHEKRLRNSEEEQRKIENAERLHGILTSIIFN